MEIKERGIFVISSNHDFNKTPSKDEIVSRLVKMKNLGGDIVKIAVMPNNTADVLDLLSATEEMHKNYPTLPIISMSMGKLGIISRISGEVFGSVMTFGSGGKLSAPGQIPIDKMKLALNIIHDSMN